jgi:hypothetical protein
MPDEVRNTGPEEPFLEINTPREHSGFYALGYILVIIISVFVCGFLVYHKFHTDSLVTDKESALEGFILTLQSKNNSEVEKKVNDINSAVRILSAEKKSKYLFKIFIDEFKTKITNDTKLNNLSIDNQGTVSMDGESKSYRSVADLALALKSSSKLGDVQIAGLSLSTDGGVSQVNFSLSANLVDWGSSGSSDAEIGLEDESGGENE